jgi:hypothetical protein
LENEILLEQDKERDEKDYQYLVETTHVDDDDEDFMKYVVTSIAITKDRHKHIIAYRGVQFLRTSAILQIRICSCSWCLENVCR